MYTHTQYQVNLTATAVDVSSSGVAGLKWSPGYVPHVIRAFSVINSSTVADQSAGTYVLQRVAATTTVVVGLATINGTATGGKGIVFYKSNLNATIAPGETLIFDVADAAGGATLLQATVWVEPRWEEPGNFTNMKLTT